MSKHRRAAKVDENQSNIVSMLRKIPRCTVSVGHDDILVGYNKKTFWFEVKRPEAISKKTGEVKASEITTSELKLLAEWEGHYSVVSTFEEIWKEISS